MKNKLLLFLLSLLITTPAGAYDFMVDGLCYNINSDGNSVTVTYQNNNSFSPWYTNLVGSINIPENVYHSGKNYLVTSIGNSAFMNCTRLTGVTIGNSVTSIGSYVFYGCTGLLSVAVGNSVTSIGGRAFDGCAGMTSIIIGNSVTSIVNDAFRGCTGLTSVTWNAESFNDLYSPDSQPFYGLDNIKTFIIGNNVAKIPKFLCYGLSGLTSIIIPNSVTSIGERAFDCCAGLASISVNNGNTKYDSRNNCNAIIETATNSLMIGCKNTIIPNSVTSIGNFAFSGCSGLTSVNIPNSVTLIGQGAFHSCSGLTSMTIPSSVTSIGSSAFGGCTGLTTVAIPNSVSSIYGYTFSNCTALTSVTISSSVKSIGEKAFSGCSSLVSVVIPTSVTSISSDAFIECTGLTSIIVENGNTVFDSRDNSNAIIKTSSNLLLAGCKNTIIPNSVTSIGNYAFYGCSGLSSVVIPSSVTSIGNYAFYECNALSLVTINSNSVLSKNYSSSNSISSIFGSQVKEYIIGDSVTSIGNRTFYQCSRLTSVTIPNSVSSIGNSAFYGCSSLGSVKINDIAAWCNIDFNDFYANPLFYSHNIYIDGSKVSNLVIPNTVTTIKKYAFYGCSGLFSVSIPSSITSIGNSAFYGCSDLYFVNINDIATWCNINFASADANPLYYANNLYINGSKVSNLVIPNTVTSIKKYAFSGCNGVTVINILNSVLSIEENAFRDCKMYSVTLPESIESIGTNAFYGCTYLYFIHSKLEQPFDISLGSNVFYNVPVSTCKLKVPIGLVEEYRNTDQWCQFVNILEMDSVINFADDNVKNLCVDQWDTDLDGELSYAEASNVTSLKKHNSDYGVFGGNKIIESFDELKYFTNLTTLNDGEFNGCIKLRRLTLPQSIGTIGMSAFRSTPWLDSIPSENGIKYYDKIALAYDGETHDVTFKNDTRLLARGLFSSYSNIGSVVLPASISSVTPMTFYISKVQKVIVPSSIINLAYNSFVYACVDTLIFEQSEEPLTMWSSYDDPCGTFSRAELGLVQIFRPLLHRKRENAGPERQENHIFGEASITKAVITDDFDLTKMFDGCAINDVVFPENLTKIGDYAFRKRKYSSNDYSYYFENDYERVYYSLTNVEIPEGVTSIGTESFFCELNSITVPNSIKTIESQAFYCYYLKDIYSRIQDPSMVALGNNVFLNANTSTCILHVPKGTVELYCNANQWKDFENIVEIEDAVYCDVNGDGNVTAADITELYNYLLNGSTTYISNSDITGDGNITAADVTAVYDVLLGNQ